MIRKLQKEDRLKLWEMIKKIDLFSKEEKDIALELIDENLDNANEAYCEIFVYVENNNILGYHCIGKRSLTEGTFDLYWIAVDPGQQKKGIGTKLIQHAESFVIQNKGNLILAETSSKENYHLTREFYLKNKYDLLSEIKDFYGIGNSLIVFGKYFRRREC